MEELFDNNAMSFAASKAKESAKKISRYKLFFSMNVTCFVAPIIFLIYFATQNETVGVWAFAVAALLALIVLGVLIAVVFPRYKEAAEDIRTYTSAGGTLKKQPPLDVFCITVVKVMFTVMSALLVCFIPLVITTCYTLAAGEIVAYLFNCLGSFWGMDTGVGGFFSYVIGLGIMAILFTVLLLFIKLVSKLLK